MTQSPPTTTDVRKVNASTAKWIEPETGRFRSRPVRVRGNTKSQANTLEPVYGCRGGHTNQGFGCPWGCYAAFTCKKIKAYKGGPSADFCTPVPQIVDRVILREDLAKSKADWMRLGVMGDPSEDWDVALDLCELVHEAGKIPVLFTRLWILPTDFQLMKMAEYGVHLHISICAFDGLKLKVDGKPIGRGPSFWEAAQLVYSRYTEHWEGKGVWRVVTFYFDDTTEVGNMLWDRQDEMMAWDSVLEQPARVMKGKKHNNPVWKYIPEWAYWKAPTTKDHKFSAYNHNWTAGVMYDRPACWVGCVRCTHQCVTRGDEK